MYVSVLKGDLFGIQMPACVVRKGPLRSSQNVNEACKQVLSSLRVKTQFLKRLQCVIIVTYSQKDDVEVFLKSDLLDTLTYSIPHTL